MRSHSIRRLSSTPDRPAIRRCVRCSRHLRTVMIATPVKPKDLAALNGHASRCVGAMLSSMIGDVLGAALLRLDSISGGFGQK